MDDIEFVGYVDDENGLADLEDMNIRLVDNSRDMDLIVVLDNEVTAT